MGSMGGLLGTAGGVSGSGIAGSQQAIIQNGTGPGQVTQSYNQNQNTLAAQQQLLQALQSQTGIQNQTSAINQQQGLSNQLAGNNGAANLGNVYGQAQGLANQLSGSGGVQNLSNALASQQGLAGQQQGTLSQYQNLANGTGPNPAQAALNQSTGQNVANQAALMAGQRGASSNVGLLARQAAQQGAATQQQAVGQGAQLQAQQQIAGLQGLSAQQQAIGNTNTNVANIASQQVAQQQAQQQALASQAAQQVGAQQAQQGAVANQANTLANQQIGQVNANAGATQAEQGILQGALANQNQSNVSSTGSVNAANSGEVQTKMGGQAAIIGGLGNAVGSALSSLAKGGIVEKPKKFADGGITPTQSAAPAFQAQSPTPNEPTSTFGKFIKGALAPQNTIQGQDFNLAGNDPNNKALQQGIGNLGQGIVSAFRSPSKTSASPSSSSVGPDILASSDLVAAKGGMAKQHDYRSGGNVKAKNPREKAVKSGNSYANDKIPAVLSEGEVVIPRSVMQSKDPAGSAALFVAKVMSKRRAS